MRWFLHKQWWILCLVSRVMCPNSYALWINAVHATEGQQAQQTIEQYKLANKCIIAFRSFAKNLHMLDPKGSVRRASGLGSLVVDMIDISATGLTKSIVNGILVMGQYIVVACDHDSQIIKLIAKAFVTYADNIGAFQHLEDNWPVNGKKDATAHGVKPIPVTNKKVSIAVLCVHDRSFTEISRCTGVGYAHWCAPETRICEIREDRWTKRFTACRPILGIRG